MTKTDVRVAMIVGYWILGTMVHSSVTISVNKINDLILL